MTAPLPSTEDPRGPGGPADPLGPGAVASSAARIRLAGAVRHVIDAVLTTEVDDEELEAAAAAAEAMAVALGGRHPSEGPPQGRRVQPVRAAADYVGRSPLIGPATPVSPPFTWEGGPDGVRAHGVFGAAYEGPPGYAHGGWIALAFDEVFGIANYASGRSSMTGSLEIRYRRPTPLHEPVEISGRVARASGRRSVVTGELTVGGRVTAEAEGHFVAIDAERRARYFGAEADRHGHGPTDDEGSEDA
ncbi:MAG: PaaI family thioesterase [Acidimicrobiia bacterium]|nr:PaaI family thioesterase [Acidimicrobiia bacterium]